MLCMLTMSPVIPQVGTKALILKDPKYCMKAGKKCLLLFQSMKLLSMLGLHPLSKIGRYMEQMYIFWNFP